MISLSKINTSSWFVLPLLELNIKVQEYLINSYLYCTEYGDLPSSLFILFKYNAQISKTGTLFDPNTSLDNPWLSIEKELLQNPNYHFHDVLDNQDKTLFCLTIPDIYEQDYQLIIQGKYSEISPKAKELVNTFWRSKDLNDILNKNEAFRKLRSQTLDIEIPQGYEVWSTPDINKETFLEDSLIKLSI